ncbi:MAG: hypothetical protein H5T84_01860, partial [Thermoleophilia bacterium]|nr:hypothetical protein [Thermoleophilia bacterium]
MIGQGISIALATLIMAAFVGKHDIKPADYPNLLTAVEVTFFLLSFLCAVGVLASLARGNLPRPQTTRSEVAPPPEVS